MTSLITHKYMVKILSSKNKSMLNSTAFPETFILLPKNICFYRDHMQPLAVPKTL